MNLKEYIDYRINKVIAEQVKNDIPKVKFKIAKWGPMYLTPEGPTQSKPKKSDIIKLDNGKDSWYLYYMYFGEDIDGSAVNIWAYDNVVDDSIKAIKKVISSKKSAKVEADGMQEGHDGSTTVIGIDNNGLWFKCEWHKKVYVPKNQIKELIKNLEELKKKTFYKKSWGKEYQNKGW